LEVTKLSTIQTFFRSEQLGGALLFRCVIISLLVANSSAHASFDALLQTSMGYHSDFIHLEYPVLLWINDGLMAIFFLLVGLEIKREFLGGELSSPKRAAMPAFAALGGMIVPAAVFYLFNMNNATRSGWGIPMATDIAFALAVVSLLGKRVPSSLKVFLAALAIVDDLGAILVIALFYTSEVHLNYLLYAGLVLLLLIAFNKAGVKKLVLYIIPGLFLWYFVHHSGIHATVAGVLLAFTIPTDPVKANSSLEKLEHVLLKPVNFLIMPIFALANTNIRFEMAMIDGLYTPLGLGIICGLFLGKVVGISAFSWVSVKSGLSSLPSGANWKHITGLGMLAGIGFTMSIFIALLSFSDAALQTEAKFSVLIASVISGMAGYFYLHNISKKTR
jgi:NhaA family Na+:H+ antiporter